MGSGTTIKAARDLGRNSVGIDINPDFVDIMRKKLNMNQRMWGSEVSYEIMHLDEGEKIPIEAITI